MPAAQRGWVRSVHGCAGILVLKLRTAWSASRWPPALTGGTYITYVNAILDQRDLTHCLMPTFGPADVLNRLPAAAVWEGMGYEVRPVDLTATSRNFGAMHCLVNVLHRD